MFQLFYGGQQHGPYVLDQIKSMWASGVITADALYWSEPDAAWKPLAELLLPTEQSPLPPQPAPQEKPEPDAKGVPIPSDSPASLPNTPAQAEPWDSTAPRPWRRHFARIFDSTLFCLVAGILAYFLGYLCVQSGLGKSQAEMAGRIIGILAFLGFIELEAYCLARFGATLGKWLLGVSVREGNGNNLSRSHARARAWKVMGWCSLVWFTFIPCMIFVAFCEPIGPKLGLGLLFVALATIPPAVFWIYLYRDIKNRGTAKWDRKMGCIVTCSQVPSYRWAVCLGGILLCGGIQNYAYTYPERRLANANAEYKKSVQSLEASGVTVTDKGVTLSPSYLTPQARQAIEQQSHLVTASDGKRNPAPGYDWLNPNDPKDLRVIQKSAASTGGVGGAATPTADPDYKAAKAWRELGSTYLVTQPEKAVDAYKHGVDLDPKNGESWYGLGLGYMFAQQPQEALNAFKRAVELDPMDSGAWGLLGCQYNELNQPRDAILACKRSVEIDLKDSDAWCAMGRAYNKLGQPGDAVIAYRRLVEIQPDRSDAWSELSDTCRRLGLYKESEEAQRKSLLIQREQSKRDGLLLYPDAGDDTAPLGKEVVRLIKVLTEAKDPLLYRTSAPFEVIQMAAKNLGIAPVKQRNQQ